MWLTSPSLSAKHGFSTRHGGVSSPPFDSLNFDDRQDDPAKVLHNRQLALGRLGFDPHKVARLNQVHSCEVLTAKVGVQTADALVSREEGLVLAIGTADCYPILFHDPVAGVVGAAHAGWKGTVGRIALHTIQAMVELGASISSLQVAIGPGIGVRQYPVGSDVIGHFVKQGFPSDCFGGENDSATRQLDLLRANQVVLEEIGVTESQVWVMGRCSTEQDFFSYRRDQGLTGRMWAVIGL